MATAKPRARASETTSKYFSMNSARPGSTSSVPLRPWGGAQRAKRNATPSGVLRTPVTAPSGTGFAGVEMSVIRAAGLRREARPYSSPAPGLNARGLSQARPLAAENPGTHIFAVQALSAARERSDPKGDPRLSLNPGGPSMRPFAPAPPYTLTAGLHP